MENKQIIRVPQTFSVEFEDLEIKKKVGFSSMALVAKILPCQLSIVGCLLKKRHLPSLTHSNGENSTLAANHCIETTVLQMFFS